MNRAPAFQFYVKDWLCDPHLRCASPASRGIWIDLLCFMWLSEKRGIVTFALQGFCEMLGVSKDCFKTFIDEAMLFGFADVTCNGDVTNCNTQVTIINRRMVREQKDRENARLRVAKHRASKASNGNVTLPSPRSPILLGNKDTPPDNMGESEGGKQKQGPVALARSRIKKHQIVLNYDQKRFENITPEDIQGWKEAYPSIDIDGEIIRTAEYWKAAWPKKRTNWRAVIVKRFAFLQEHQHINKPSSFRSVTDEEIERIADGYKSKKTS